MGRKIGKRFFDLYNRLMFKLTLKKVLIVLAIILMSVVGLTGLVIATAPLWYQEPVSPNIEDGSATIELDAAQATWLERGPSDYKMIIEETCFCIGPHRVAIVVRDGKPVKVTPKRWIGYRTVPQMFEDIEDKIEGEIPFLGVVYNDEYGFPSEISIDVIANAVDDEALYAVKQFRKLQPLD